jgi:hypothetical protein
VCGGIATTLKGKHSTLSGKFRKETKECGPVERMVVGKPRNVLSEMMKSQEVVNSNVFVHPY